MPHAKCGISKMERTLAFLEAIREKMYGGFAIKISKILKMKYKFIQEAKMVLLKVGEQNFLLNLLFKTKKNNKRLMNRW